MAFVQVTPGELSSAAGKIDGYNGDLVAAAKRIEEAATSLEGSWQGTDYDNFMGYINDLMAWYNEASSVITQYTQAMRAAANSYIEMDQDSAAAIKG